MRASLFPPPFSVLHVGGKRSCLMLDVAFCASGIDHDVCVVVEATNGMAHIFSGRIRCTP